MKRPKWKISESEDLYNIPGWGDPYFSVNKAGHVAVHPTGQGAKAFSIKTLVDQIVERGIQPPFLLRFNDIVTHRLSAIEQAFERAVKDNHYKGKHAVIYPIKVNQQRHVVDQIAAYCKMSSFGLEAGSKPELAAVLALAEKESTPIICNGYKDREYFEMVLMGAKMGKPIYPVIEKFSEFKTIAAVAEGLKVKPKMGVRVKLSSPGSGKWQSSGGHRSKFGLTINELMRGLDFLRENDLLDGLKLLHFHLGSQITDIAAIKRALKEAARVYVELVRAGVPLEIMDVGGGLGIDYDGSSTNQDSSVNYTLDEYASDVIFQIKEICDDAKVGHPHIYTECGRAVAAHHSVLITNVLGISAYDRTKLPSKIDEDSPKPLHELFEIQQSFRKERVIESYHDATNSFKECLSLFSLGFMNLSDRGVAEDIFFSICKRCQRILESAEEVPDDLKGLEDELSDTYFCNLSIFQSLPDLWAIDHRFPIMPIHRLKEEPTRTATIADITCDSDGKIDCFINPRRAEKRTIKLHPHQEGEQYYIGVFLVGAYQETLGDLHNLFGDTNAVHIVLDKKNKPIIETVVKGDTVKEVLSHVQYDVNELILKMHRQLENAVRRGRIGLRESGDFLKFYETAMEGYTYLEETEAEEEY
jgi:arginine decarboxylase